MTGVSHIKLEKKKDTRTEVEAKFLTFEKLTTVLIQTK